MNVRVIARNDGAPESSADAGTVLSNPFDARPAELEADERLTAEPDLIQRRKERAGKRTIDELLDQMKEKEHGEGS
jgi:hypothetical protein